MPVGMGRGGHNREHYKHSEITAAHIALARRGIDWKNMSAEDCIQQYVELQDPIICAEPGCMNQIGTIGRQFGRKYGFYCKTHAPAHYRTGENNPSSTPEVRKKISASLMNRDFTDQHKANLKKVFNDTKCHQKMWDAMAPEERERRGKVLSVFQKAHWDGMTPEEKERRLKDWLKSPGPNRQEQQVQGILDEMFPGEYEFCGDFKQWIGGKNPDFINVAGQKKLIEFYGTYWHPEETGEEGRRMAHFQQHGFDTLIIRDAELHNIPKLKAKLKQFHGVTK